MAAARGRSDDQTRRHQHQILDDVLPFQRRHQRKHVEGLVPKKQQRQKGSGHLRHQQQQGQPQKAPGEQPQSDGALPGRQQRQADGGRNQSEAQHRDGIGGQFLRHADAGKELEHPEPEEHHAQREPQQGNAVQRPPADHAVFERHEFPGQFAGNSRIHRKFRWFWQKAGAQASSGAFGAVHDGPPEFFLRLGMSLFCSLTSMYAAGRSLDVDCRFRAAGRVLA